MSKQLEFFPDAYLSEEAIKKNRRAKRDLEEMLKEWESRKRLFTKITTLENLFLTLNKTLKFPIIITQVNRNHHDGFMESFVCTDKEERKAEIKLWSYKRQRDLSLEVFIENHQTTRYICFIGDFVIQEEKITTQLNDKTIIRYYDMRSPEIADIYDWSIKIITKDNIAFQIHVPTMNGKNLELFFENLELFCYDNIDTAQQLYLKIKERFKVEHCYTRVYKITDGNEHLKSSYYVRGERCLVFGEYFEENNGCIEASLVDDTGTKVNLAYYKNGGKILEFAILAREDIKPYCVTRITIDMLGKVGDLGLIQRQINDNYKRICKKVIVGHRYQKYFKKNLN